MDNTFAEHFATDWIDSWNAHDLDRILSHYEEDFEMTSPIIVQVVGGPSGMLRGKSAVGAYWQKALARTPDLKFELLSVFVGVNSIMLHYKGARGRLASEVFHFGQNQKVTRAFAHYAS
jgi:ketosteroid isomerase-like protein